MTRGIFSKYSRFRSAEATVVVSQVLSLISFSQGASKRGLRAALGN